MKIDVILLDMDGVVCNWVKSMLALFGRDYDEVVANWPADEFEAGKVIGKTEAEVWAAIDSVGHDFWANLEELPRAKDLYDGCLKIAPVHFLTTPSRHPSSLSGKLDWMHKFTGDNLFRNYLVGPQKQLCAKPGHVLVDDYHINTDKFVANGGKAILMPRIWNSNRSIQADPVDYVFESLENILAE